MNITDLEARLIAQSSAQDAADVDMMAYLFPSGAANLPPRKAQ